MDSYLEELPMGLGMALANNPVAMNYFMGMSADEQRQFVEGTHQIRSKSEMQHYVNSLTGRIK
ncbi:MAG: hypothetical protein Q3985_03290 [Eubacteriales bacterium]|nr:hypothetical protein [Eubacteriales bacterium]